MLTQADKRKLVYLFGLFVLYQRLNRVKSQRERYIRTEQTCRFIYRDNEGYITSPNYPNIYPSKQNCSYTMETSENQQISLNIEEFVLETSKLCNFDKLSIFDGKDTNAPLLRTYCGRVAPEKMFSSGNSITALFVSDNDGELKGFKIRYKAVKRCYQEFASSEGQILSPFYPSVYPHNIECHYLVKVADYQSVRISFKDFKLENVLYENCFDYVQIAKHGESSWGRFGEVFCANEAPKDFCVDSKDVMIRFTSDNVVSDTGFKAVFEVGDVKCDGTRHPKQMKNIASSSSRYLKVSKTSSIYFDKMAISSEAESRWKHNKNSRLTFSSSVSRVGSRGHFKITSAKMEFSSEFSSAMLRDNKKSSRVSFSQIETEAQEIMYSVPYTTELTKPISTAHERASVVAAYSTTKFKEREGRYEKHDEDSMLSFAIEKQKVKASSYTEGTRIHGTLLNQESVILSSTIEPTRTKGVLRNSHLDFLAAKKDLQLTKNLDSIPTSTTSPRTNLRTCVDRHITNYKHSERLEFTSVYDTQHTSLFSTVETTRNTLVSTYSRAVEASKTSHEHDSRAKAFKIASSKMNTSPIGDFKRTFSTRSISMIRPQATVGLMSAMGHKNSKLQYHSTLKFSKSSDIKDESSTRNIKMLPLHRKTGVESRINLVLSRSIATSSTSQTLTSILFQDKDTSNVSTRSEFNKKTEPSEASFVSIMTKRISSKQLGISNTVGSSAFHRKTEVLDASVDKSSSSSDFITNAPRSVVHNRIDLTQTPVIATTATISKPSKILFDKTEIVTTSDSKQYYVNIAVPKSSSPSENAIRFNPLSVLASKEAVSDVSSVKDPTTLKRRTEDPKYIESTGALSSSTPKLSLYPAPRQVFPSEQTLASSDAYGTKVLASILKSTSQEFKQEFHSTPNVALQAEEPLTLYSKSAKRTTLLPATQHQTTLSHGTQHPIQSKQRKPSHSAHNRQIVRKNKMTEILHPVGSLGTLRRSIAPLQDLELHSTRLTTSSEPEMLPVGSSVRLPEKRYSKASSAEFKIKFSTHRAPEASLQAVKLMKIACVSDFKTLKNLKTLDSSIESLLSKQPGETEGLKKTTLFTTDRARTSKDFTEVTFTTFKASSSVVELFAKENGTSPSSRIASSRRTAKEILNNMRSVANDESLRVTPTVSHSTTISTPFMSIITSRKTESLAHHATSPRKINYDANTNPAKSVISSIKTSVIIPEIVRSLIQKDLERSPEHAEYEEGKNALLLDISKSKQNIKLTPIKSTMYLSSRSSSAEMHDTLLNSKASVYPASVKTTNGAFLIPEIRPTPSRKPMSYSQQESDASSIKFLRHFSQEDFSFLELRKHSTFSLFDSLYRSSSINVLHSTRHLYSDVVSSGIFKSTLEISPKPLPTPRMNSVFPLEKRSKAKDALPKSINPSSSIIFLQSRHAKRTLQSDVLVSSHSKDTNTSSNSNSISTTSLLPNISRIFHKAINTTTSASAVLKNTAQIPRYDMKQQAISKISKATNYFVEKVIQATSPRVNQKQTMTSMAMTQTLGTSREDISYITVTSRSYKQELASEIAMKETIDQEKCSNHFIPNIEKIAENESLREYVNEVQELKIKNIIAVRWPYNGYLGRIGFQHKGFVIQTEDNRLWYNHVTEADETIYVIKLKSLQMLHKTIKVIYSQTVENMTLGDHIKAWGLKIDLYFDNCKNSQ